MGCWRNSASCTERSWRAEGDCAADDGGGVVSLQAAGNRLGTRISHQLPPLIVYKKLALNWGSDSQEGIGGFPRGKSL